MFNPFPSIAAAFWAVVGFMTPAQWQAAAAVGTFVVALVAAVFAFRQVREARRTREDQARPYVAAYLEMDGFIVEMVVKNFGNSVARDLTITPDAPMFRGEPLSNGQPDPIALFDAMPVLVPGQEWRTFFDTGTGLTKSGAIHTVALKYSDARGRLLPSDDFTLDWHPFESIIYGQKKDLDDVGKSLEKIATTLGNWTEGLNGLKVYTRSGAEKDQRELERYRDFQKRHAEGEAARSQAATDEAAASAAGPGDKSETEQGPDDTV